MSQDIRIIHLAGTPSVVNIGQGPAGPVGPIDETVAANLAEEVTARASGDEALATAIANEASLRAAADTTAAAAATSALNSHTSRTDNPHGVTKSQIGLGNVPNTDATQRGNHTGTQTLSTISDAGSAAALNTGTSAGNIPILDGTAKLPVSTIPAIAITDYLGAVSSQAAMLALTGQKGDWCTRTDEGKTYLITGPDPSIIAGWTALSYPAAPVTSVAGKTGSVSLSKPDVGLANVDNTSDANKPVSTATQTALDGKQPLDSDLTAIAALSSDGIPQRSGGAWSQVMASFGSNGSADSGRLVKYGSNGDLRLSSQIRLSETETGCYSGFSVSGLTANRDIVLPDADGKVIVTSDGLIHRENLADVSTGGHGSADSSHLVEYDESGTLTSSFGITFSDPNVGYVLRFTPGDDNLTSDRVILIPDANGTMALTSDFFSYIGSTSINTVGTISDGASYWQANPIGTGYGGTGMDNSALPANRFLYTTSTGTFAAGVVTSAGRALIDDADATAQRATLGLSALATTIPATGVATFLSSPTSANLRAALTDETGTGSLVFVNGNIGSATASSLGLSAGTGITPISVIKTSGSDDYLRFTNSSGFTGLSVDSYQQLSFNVGANGPIYFGTFGNPSLGRGGFSLPNFVMMGIDSATRRMGIGADASASAWFVYNAPDGLLEIRGKADERQLVVQGYTSQTNSLQEWRSSSGATVASMSGGGSLTTSGIITTTLSASGQVELTGQSATNATSAMTRLLSGQLGGSALPLLGYTLPSALYTYNGSSQTTHFVTIRPSGYVDNTITASSARTKGTYGEILASGTGSDFLINSASSLTNPETAVIVFRCTADSTINGIVRYRSFNVLRGSGNAYIYFTGSAATVTSSSIAASTSTICVAVFSGDGAVSRYHFKAGANKVSGSWNDASNTGDTAGAGYIQANAGHGGIANGVEFIGGFLFAGKASANQLEALAEHYYGLFA